MLGLPSTDDLQLAAIGQLEATGGANAHTLHKAHPDVPLWLWYDVFVLLHRAKRVQHEWKPVNLPRHFAAQVGWYTLAPQ